MAEEPNETRFLIGLLLATILVGAFVLIVKSDYRLEQIAMSNEDYYPQIRLEMPSDKR